MVAISLKCTLSGNKSGINLLGQNMKPAHRSRAGNVEQTPVNITVVLICVSIRYDPPRQTPTT